jgi:hypothetical protein
MFSVDFSKIHKQESKQSLKWQIFSFSPLPAVFQVQSTVDLGQGTCDKLRSINLDTASKCDMKTQMVNLQGV